MTRYAMTGVLLALLMVLLPTQVVWALSIDSIEIDSAGSLNFTLSNDDAVAYDGIIIQTPFTSIDQFQLGGIMPASWTQSYTQGSENILSIYVAPAGAGMEIGQTQTFSVGFDTILIPKITDFINDNAGTFTITAFSNTGNFSGDYTLASTTVPLPASGLLLISGLGLLITAVSTGRLPGLLRKH